MSMSGTQIAAFNAASASTPQAFSIFFLSIVIALSMLWAAWALYSIYRGWATQNIDRATAGASAIRIFVLLMILSALVLS